MSGCIEDPEGETVINGRCRCAKSPYGESDWTLPSRLCPVHSEPGTHPGTQAKVAAEWERLYDERNRLWRAAEDRLDAVRQLLEQNGCDCDCDHDSEGHDDCERCLACRINAAVQP